MKNKSAKILLVFVASILAAGAAAFEQVTLKDNFTGMAVILYPTDSDNFLFYGNMPIGYNVLVPSMIFTEVVLLPENEYGMILESKDGKARFHVTGGYVMDDNDDEGTLRESFDRACETIGGEEEATSFEVGDDYWELIWREDDDTLHRRKFLIKKGAGVWSDIEIYNVSPEGDVNPLDKVIDYVIDSLVFASG